jgi:chemotaxis family two-component system response regulator Rcp1
MVEIDNPTMLKPDTGVVRILIVEDNRGDVLLVREALKESNLKFELTHIADGEQAFDYLQRRGVHRNADLPNLVLLDLNLPRRDGWEVLDEIRTMPDLRATPVVILSSSGNPEDRERAARTPNSLYIRKPSTLDEFLAVGKQIEDFWSNAHNG